MTKEFLIFILFIIFFWFKPELIKSWDGIYLKYTISKYDSLSNIYWIEHRYFKLINFKSNGSNPY